jgi:wobble nucleotide-excising tRNase
MLKEIKFIQSIGRFETGRPTPGASLGRCTLIFGENGWGKSTLADLLRSLTTGNPAILIGRRTLDATTPSKAVLTCAAGNAVFENGAWTGQRPRIAVYDSAFINDNVFSGDIVSADHLKNQYGLVVGEEGVRLVRRIVELDGENRDNNNAARGAETELSAIMRAVAPQGMQPAAFLALPQRADIDDAIAAKQAETERARRARELKAAAEPALLPVPTETIRFREALAASIEQVAGQALARVRAHIAAHDAAHRQGSVAHENWIEAGTAFVSGADCPFCGQALTDRSLIDAYSGFFSEAYKALGASVRAMRDTLARYASGDFRRRVTELAEQNTRHFRYWQEAAALPPPVAADTAGLIARMEETAARLDTLFGRKQLNLTDAIGGAEADAAFAAWEEARSAVAAETAKIDAFLAALKTLKDSLDQAALPALEADLKLLQATKRRHEPEIVALAGRIAACSERKDAIAKEKAEVRAALDAHGRTITASLGQTINTYLARLAAGFRIDYREPDYRGKEPAASYDILIREVPVSPRAAATELDKASFRNTLSAGDKSTLALAFFLAKVNADPNLAGTIVVLDDPFTSLDSFRRQFTAIEIRTLCLRAQQVIVLSHEKTFLRLLWEKIGQGNITSLALQTGARGVTTIAPFDIESATQPRHLTERMQIEEFIEGEPHDPVYIRTRLRTVCEDFYRKGDPGLFGQAANLEEIVRRLSAAPADHPYKPAVDDLRDINEYSRGDAHAAKPGNPAEETSIEELKEFCRRVLELTRGM